MTLRARLGQGALSLAHLAGLRPAARTPAPAAMEQDGPTPEEIAQREANDTAIRTASLAGIQPAAEGAQVEGDEGEQEEEIDPINDLRRRVEDLERRMPAEDCEADADAAVAAFRARVTAIFAEPAVAAHTALAVALTFGTDKDAETVIAELRAAAKAATGLDARMAGAPSAALPPAQPTITPKEAVSASWDNAFAAVRRR